MKTVTLDFGDGCELRNGNFVSGKIIMTYERDPEAASKMITYSFEDFYFNRKNVEGGGSISGTVRRYYDGTRPSIANILVTQVLASSSRFFSCEIRSYSLMYHK